MSVGNPIGVGRVYGVIPRRARSGGRYRDLRLAGAPRGPSGPLAKRREGGVGGPIRRAPVGPAPTSTRAEPPPFDVDATRRLIGEQNARFTQAHLTGDIGLIESMFAPDATAFPRGAAAVTGLPELHDLTVEYLNAGLTEFREATTDFYGNAEFVVDAG